MKKIRGCLKTPFFYIPIIAFFLKMVYNTVRVNNMFGFSCPIYRFFGIPCPTCGITRAYILFFRGHFLKAFLMHPLFLLPVIFLFPAFRKRRIVFSVIGIFLAVYTVRFLLLFPNVPPFTYNAESTLQKILKGFEIL